jgi:polysaccharide biosynthesis transport protein
MHGHTESRGPHTVARSLRRHLLLVVLLGLVGLVAGSVYTAGRPAAYRATATVLVEPLVGNPYAPGDEDDVLASLETEAEVLRSDEVTDLALRRLPVLLSRSTLQDHVFVSVPENTRLLEVTFTGSGREVARQGAQAYATAYLDHRRRRAREATTGPPAAAEQQRRAVVAALRAATASARTGSREDRAVASGLVEALNAELAGLHAGSVGLEHAVLAPGRVVSAASTPPPLGGPQRVRFVLAGLAGGLLAGLLLALARAGRTRHPDDAVNPPPGHPG